MQKKNYAQITIRKVLLSQFKINTCKSNKFISFSIPFIYIFCVLLEFFTTIVQKSKNIRNAPTNLEEGKSNLHELPLWISLALNRLIPKFRFKRKFKEEHPLIIYSLTNYW